VKKWIYLIGLMLFFVANVNAAKSDFFGERDVVAAKGGGSLIAKGLGSTGRTTAANLTEQLAMKEIVANPTLGKTVMTGMNITHDHWK